MGKVAPFKQIKFSRSANSGDISSRSSRSNSADQQIQQTFQVDQADQIQADQIQADQIQADQMINIDATQGEWCIPQMFRIGCTAICATSPVFSSSCPHLFFYWAIFLLLSHFFTTEPFFIEPSCRAEQSNLRNLTCLQLILSQSKFKERKILKFTIREQSLRH